MNKFILKLMDNFFEIVNRAVFKKNISNADIKINSILIIKLSAMGDALCLMPSVRALSKAFPDAKITWVTTNRTSPNLFRNLPFLDEIILIPASFRHLYKIPFILFRLKHYDLAIDFDQYYKFSEFISNFAKFNAGFITPLKGNSFSIFRNYNSNLNEKTQFKLMVDKVILRLGGGEVDFIPLLPEIHDNFKPTQELTNQVNFLVNSSLPVIFLYPGSSENAKYRRWDMDNFLKVANELSDSYMVIFSGGVNELEYSSRIPVGNPRILDWINKWSLQEWSWIFSCSNFAFLGNDAGLYHIADLQGVRMFGIFGPNLSVRWGSLNPTAHSFEVGIECSPCINTHLGSIPSKCWRNDVKCLTLISPKEVCGVIKEKYFVKEVK